MTTLWATEAALYVGIDNRGNIVTSVSCYLISFSRFYSAEISRKLSHKMRDIHERVTQG